MAREPITDHSDQAIARLPGFEQDGSNWGKLVRSLVDSIQRIEDTLTDFLDERAISTAVGLQLDGIGTILDLDRAAGESDNSYRIRLQGQASQLAQSGEIESIIAAWQLIWGSTLTILKEYQPATVEVTAVLPSYVPDAETEAAALASINAVVAAGVGTIAQVVEDPYFLWGDLADVDGSGDLPTSTIGFGDDADADGNGDIAAGDGGGNLARTL